jgi:hypothetical protein
MLIDKGVHMVETSFTNGWTNEYVEGDVVLRGFWYDRLFANSRTYFLKDDKLIAYVFLHPILASKFSMPPTCHTIKGKYTSYELNGDQMHLKQQNCWIKLWYELVILNNIHICFIYLNMFDFKVWLP